MGGVMYICRKHLGAPFWEGIHEIGSGIVADTYCIMRELWKVMTDH
jgi:hypothetical protein